MKSTKLFKKAVYFYLLGILLAGLQLNAQVSEQWSVRYAGISSGTDQAKAMAVDASGNVYVTGSSGTFGTEDIATIKYNTSGVMLWVKRYNGTAGGSDYGNAVAVDGTGNVYITGKSWTSTSNFDVITIKYNSAGDTLWTKRFNGARNGQDMGNSIAVDGAGNVYLTGSSEGTVGTHGIFEDYVTIKYNSAGLLMWALVYNGPGGDYDAAYSIAIDGSGNVLVTGESGGGSGGSGLPYQDFATLKYNSAGVLQWVKRYNGSANGDDIARQIKLDASDNVYVTGSVVNSTTYKDYATIKYNSAGTQMWISTYTSAGSSTDESYSLAVDRAGNVFVTGKSWASSNYNIFTIKYNTSGTELWTNSFNGTANGNDAGQSIALDSFSNVYVTGYSNSITTADDYTTIKYNTSGAEQWVIKYSNSGAPGSSDQAVSVFADNTGNVYVTGMSALDYATVKYSPVTGITNYTTTASGFDLMQNFPNPFNPNSKIRYQIAARSAGGSNNNQDVKIAVFDITGKEIAQLVNKNQNAGMYEVDFDGTNYSAGTYFYSLIINGHIIDTKKMMLLK